MLPFGTFFVTFSSVNKLVNVRLILIKLNVFLTSPAPCCLTTSRGTAVADSKKILMEPFFNQPYVAVLIKIQPFSGFAAESRPGKAGLGCKHGAAAYLVFPDLDPVFSAAGCFSEPGGGLCGVLSGWGATLF